MDNVYAYLATGLALLGGLLIGHGMGFRHGYRLGILFARHEKGAAEKA
jgi:hypothetical protein